jgi:endonuclease/exonuclease/phosphatase family metal-dependent hydrolase
VQSEPYDERCGRTIEQAVQAVFAHTAAQCHGAGQGSAGSGNRTDDTQGVQLQRVRLIGGERTQRLLPVYGYHQQQSAAPDTAAAADQAVVPPVVAALGPIGLVYCAQQLAQTERAGLARELVQSAQIPLVMINDGDGRARAWTSDGEFCLPDDRARLFGSQHPFLDDVAHDLIGLCHHPDSGDFVLCGWRDGVEPVSFAHENGAHAGVCPEETRAFALLPEDIALPASGNDYLRPLGLRQAVFHHLGRDDPEHAEVAPRRSQRDSLRLMTYNVHSCIGMDGKLSPERIARLIAHYQPDIVALQELDQGRARTGGVDQAQEIARYLQMEFHFHPALHIEEERYGDAILTHLPMRLVKAGALPGLERRPQLEPRGALWVAVDIGDGRELQIINTHLGLSGRERQRQVKALLGDEWLGHPQCRQPLLLCGDLNALPGSRVCRQLGQRLHYAQQQLADHKPRATFSGRYPALRIDHVFVSDNVKVVAVAAPRTAMTRVASDHLPLLVDLNIDKLPDDRH